VKKTFGAMKDYQNIDSVPAPVRRVSAFLNRRAVSWNRVAGGSTPTLRWIVHFDEGQSVFLKIANNPAAADWLRTEYLIYRSLKADFLPQLHGWQEDARQPMLVLEDLSSAIWPPPWSALDVQRVIEALSRVHRSGAPVNRSLLETGRAGLRSWAQVRANSAPFLSLGLCSQSWLDKALPVLEKSESLAHFDGNDLLHGDVKSGNICLIASRVVFIDWNWACRGNGVMDIATWLPSLEQEGGPISETLLPGQPHVAAAVAGNLALRAAKKSLEHFPQLRSMQLQKLRHALPWACRMLDLPAPDLMTGD
jgi:thiamine kinase-like enzyme